MCCCGRDFQSLRGLNTHSRSCYVGEIPDIKDLLIGKPEQSNIGYEENYLNEIIPKNLLKKDSNYQNATRSGSELTRFFVIHLVKILILMTLKHQLITYKKLCTHFSRINTA